MIFGFNTDVKHGSTVYHVQSEARERELRLQTQVFVSGRCIAKRATSYADEHSRLDFSSDEMHDLLRAQHREVIELVRDGRLNEVSSPAEAIHAEAESAVASEHPDPTPDVFDAPTVLTITEPAALPTPASLALDWVNRSNLYLRHDGPLELQFLVSEAGACVSDARVIVKLNGASGPAHYGQATTGGDGRALVPIAFNAGDHGELIALLVQASARGRSVTRKFHLRRGN
jgi:hypothetical protein